MKNLRARRLGALIAAFSAISIAAAACESDPTLALPREGAPRQLGFVIGGFGTDFRQVELRKDTVVFRHVAWSDGAVDSVRAVPTAEQWRGFWASVDEIGVDQWRRRYVNPRVVDGLGWQLLLQTEEREIVSTGSNSYPGPRGRENEEEMTPEFLAFLDTLGDLVGVEIL
ncbi:MAG TPA: hypothetical protein VFR81_14270 [Longimicrobium sp.]|nr:hypothetical protein [Longimicrobium sp.]